MGGCISSARDGTSPNGDSSDGTGAISIGRNQALKPDQPKWKSDVPLTEGQLRSKRDEFWDTAPAFEGRKEIWDALKAAAYAQETADHDLAQAILDGASISLPNGTLMECYDELGNRYQLPVYVLTGPTNLIEEASEADTIPDDSSSAVLGSEILVKFHLSTGKDIKLPIRTTDSVLAVKRKILAAESVEPAKQRMFFAGKQLVDKLRIEDAKILKGYTVQVVISQPLQVSS